MSKRVIIIIIVVVLVGIGVMMSFKFDFGMDLKEENDEPYISGEICLVSDDNVLLAEEIDAEECTGDLNELKGSAGYFRVDEETKIIGKEGKEIPFDELMPGNQAKIWTVGPIMESYPVQASASKIELLEEGEELEAEGSKEEKDDKEKERNNEWSYNEELGGDLKEVKGQITECLYSVKGVPSPKGVSFSPDEEEFWVTSLMNESEGVVVFERKTGKKKEGMTLPGGGGVEIIFDQSGSYAFVSQMETGRVFMIDADKKKIVETFDTEGSWTKVMDLSPDEETIYASNWSSHNVSAIDLGSGKVTDLLSAVNTPRGIYATEDGSELYVAGFEKGEIQRINLHTKESEVIYESGGSMRHIVGDEKNETLYFSDMGNAAIYEFDKEDEEVRKFADTERNPNTIALSPDNKVLAVSNRGANHPSGNYNIPGPEWGSVLFFDTSTGEAVDAILGGNQPTALDISESGKYLAFSNFLDGEINICKFPETKDMLEGEGGGFPGYKEKIAK